jgi:hypothetical protein
VGWRWWWWAPGALVAAYCLAFRRYGLELADEGALLAHLDRVAQGHVPYRDFHVGYGPGLYWLHALSFAVFGVSIGTVRSGLVLVHALRAVLLARLGGAAGGGWWAAALVLALVAFFLPVAPGLCAPGNIPYPAWFADALGLTALTLLARDRAPMLAIGMLWGVVFAIRQNSGVFGLGAAVVTTMLAGESAAGRRTVPLVLAAGLVAGALLVLREHLDVTLAMVFAVPLVPLAVAMGRASASAATTAALARLGAGFAIAAGSVVAVMMVLAGPSAVLTEFLQIGTDTVRTYHAAHPTAGDVVRSLAGVGAGRAARLLAEASWFVVFPLLHLVAAVLVATGRIRSRLGLVLVPAAALGYLQLYPRMDFWHLLPLAPASLATGALVAAMLPRLVARVVLVGLVLASLVRLAPTVALLPSLRAPDDAPPRIARLDIRWDLVEDERLRRLPDVIEAVGDRERVAGFPALGIVNFALGRPSPWRHDYFFPGRPGPEEERVLVDQIERDPPDAVVVLDAPGPTFEAAFAAHAPLMRALDARLREAARIGPYRILVPGSPP